MISVGVLGWERFCSLEVEHVLANRRIPHLCKSGKNCGSFGSACNVNFACVKILWNFVHFRVYYLGCLVGSVNCF